MYIANRPVIVALAALGLIAAIAPTAARAQEPLSLDDAIQRAVRQNPAIRAASAGVQEAAARADQARAGWLPRVDITESWQRGDQPVFVFGSLLAQRQFGPENFAIDALNHPAAINNFRTAITAEQLVFDGGRRESGIRQASLASNWRPWPARTPRWRFAWRRPRATVRC